jgi:hypothetical protein
MRTLFSLWLLLWAGVPMLAPAVAVAQTVRHLITESTATVGRGGELSGSNGFVTGVVAVADAGVRWTRRSGLGFGVSVFAGRDFPNEATLVGLRLRISRRVGSGMLEGAVSGVASSAGPGRLGHTEGLGAILGLAYYPVPSMAVLMQLDILPTYRAGPWADPSAPSEILSRPPAVSMGARLAGRPGRIPWIAAGILGGMAILFKY